MLSLLPTPEQEQIASATRDLLAASWPIERLRAAGANAGTARWQELAALGAFGLGLPEQHGGLGLSAVEELMVFREFGRFLLPPRVLASVLGARLAALTGKADLATSIIAGHCRVGLLNALTLPDIAARISGKFLLVDGDDCELLLVWNQHGAALLSRDTAAPADARASLDDHVRIESCSLDQAAALAWLPASREPLFRRADLLIAAMHVGIAEATRDMAVDYAKLRLAFGQAIGAFQAIKHRCADMAVRAEAAWCQCAVAAVGLRDDDAAVALDVSAARRIASEAALTNAEGNIQIHGGMGFSEEAHPHFFLKRALLLTQLASLGSSNRADLLAPVGGQAL